MRGLRQLYQVVGGVCHPQRREEEGELRELRELGEEGEEGEEGELDHQLKVQLQRMKPRYPIPVL